MKFLKGLFRLMLGCFYIFIFIAIIVIYEIRDIIRLLPGKCRILVREIKEMGEDYKGDKA